MDQSAKHYIDNFLNDYDLILKMKMELEVEKEMARQGHKSEKTAENFGENDLLGSK